ncbi:hypothetical protein V6N12_046586 [Hibiscus sabdariffa]|uniref:Uncharacterized protein n=1 Tax=Hibiscus sabdariffa TaxID=183260 RepID=A0ABR2DJ29_9ROSI
MPPLHTFTVPKPAPLSHTTRGHHLHHHQQTRRKSEPNQRRKIVPNRRRAVAEAATRGGNFLTVFRDLSSPFLRSRAEKVEEEAECFQMVILARRNIHRSNGGGGGDKDGG